MEKYVDNDFQFSDMLYTFNIEGAAFPPAYPINCVRFYSDKKAFRFQYALFFQHVSAGPANLWPGSGSAQVECSPDEPRNREGRYEMHAR
jgi:hypothetical protein